MDMSYLPCSRKMRDVRYIIAQINLIMLVKLLMYLKHDYIQWHNPLIFRSGILN